MAASETARLIATLELKDKFSASLKGAQGGLGKLESRWDAISGKVGRGLVIGGAAGAAFIGTQVKAGLDSLAALESAVSSVDGAIAQVGPTWSTTGAQIAATANRIEADVGAAFDDKDITKATETLIRYGKVTESNLTPAMEIMTDLAARTGSVEGAATLLAKALADPTKAAGKLARQGIVLTKAQQATIKEMVEVNDLAGAQAYLLGELEKTTKGAASASLGPYARSQALLADAWEDGQRALAEGFLPVIEKVRGLLQKGLADPRTLENIRNFGKGLASGLDSVIEIARALPWGTIGQSLQLAGTGAKAVLSAFTSLPPWVQTAVLTGWGLNKLSGGLLSGVVGELGKGLVKGVLGMTAGVVHIKAGTVVGAGGGVPPVAGGAGRLATAATLIPAVAVAGAIVAAAVPIGQAFAAALPASLKGEGGKGMSESQTRILAAQKAMADKQGDTVNKMVSLERTFDRKQEDLKAATERVKQAQQETKRESARGTGVVQSAVDRSAATIRNGFALIRPPQVSVNVSVSPTTINRVTNVTNRYGTTSGDRHSNSTGSGTLGNGGR
jgi:hypothetical protein